jgi:hypothetical protein
MEMPRLLDLPRHDWWMLAIVVSTIWGVEGLIEGNTFAEILVGPVMVLLWACAVYAIDRWVVRIPDHKGTGRPG